ASAQSHQRALSEQGLRPAATDGESARHRALEHHRSASGAIELRRHRARMQPIAAARLELPTSALIFASTTEIRATRRETGREGEDLRKGGLAEEDFDFLVAFKRHGLQLAGCL